jgi:enoyl-CoA hydratase
MRQGMELTYRLAELPRPLLIATSGHAMALGAILLFTGDVRVGANNAKAKIGMNEVHIGIPLPQGPMELARWRLTPRYFTRSTSLGSLYGPEEAVAAGFLDELVAPDDLLSSTASIASQYAKLKTGPLVKTKQFERKAIIDVCRASLPSDSKIFGAV